MRQLMNLMNLVKRKRGVAGLSKKIRDIFFESGSGTLILGSLMFICFIKSLYEAKKGEFVRQLTHINIHLMNLMNIYEVRLFKRFFEKVALAGKDLMNMKMHLTSLRFINWEA